MTRHVVWDWNGTLLNDFPALLGATNAMAPRWGWPVIDREYYQHEFSRPLKDFYAKLLGRPVADDEYERLNDEWLVEYHALRALQGLADDAHDALAAVDDAGGTQSLCSMYEHFALMEVLAEHELVEHFVTVHGNDGSHHFKQAQLDAHLADVATALGHPPVAPVLIGDTIDDAEAARGVGIDCVLVTTGEIHRTRLEATGAPVADSLMDALAIAGITNIPDTPT
ncbi:MAG: HAD family hydrolase [Acidimicrobiia bacterium]